MSTGPRLGTLSKSVQKHARIYIAASLSPSYNADP